MLKFCFLIHFALGLPNILKVPFLGAGFALYSCGRCSGVMGGSHRQAWFRCNVFLLAGVSRVTSLLSMCNAAILSLTSNQERLTDVLLEIHLSLEVKSSEDLP